MARFITPILAIVIAVALFFTVAQPALERTRAAERDLTEYRQAIDRAEQLRQRIDELTFERDRISSQDLARLDALLPERIDPIALALLLDTIAGDNNLALSDIDITVEERPEAEPVETLVEDEFGESQIVFETPAVDRSQQFIRTAISFSLAGTYEQFRSMLAALEDSLVLMDIANLEITEPAEAGLATYAVTVHVYEYEPSR